MSEKVLIFPSRRNARALYRLVAGWVTFCERENAKHILIDLGQAHDLDYSSFEILLIHLRENLGARVELHNVPAHIEHTLRCLDLLHGSEIVLQKRARSFPRAHTRIEQRTRRSPPEGPGWWNQVS